MGRADSRRLTDADLGGGVQGGVGAQALAGVRWVGMARGGAQVASLLSSLAVARLVAPSEFGRAAIVLLLAQLGSVIGTEALVTPLVRRRELTRQHLETGSLLALIAGVAAAAVVVLASLTVVGAIFDARTGRLGVLAALICLFPAFGSVPRAVLARRLDFKTSGIAEFLSVTLGTVVTLVLALIGMDATSLIIGAIAGAAASAGVLVASAPSVRPRWNGEMARQLTGFAASSGSASLLYTFTRSAGVWIVGAQLGAQATGLYHRANVIAHEYPAKVSSVMMTIAFPVYSRAADLKQAIAFRRRIVRVHAAILFPPLLLVVALGGTLVPWLYGEAWADAAVPTQLLAVGGLAQVILSGTGPIILAAGHPGALARYNAVLLVATLAVGIVAAEFSLVVLTAALAGLALVNLLAVQWLLIRRLVGIPLSELWHDAGPATIAGGALVAAALAVSQGLEAVGAPDAIMLLAAILTGLGIYVIVLRAVSEDSANDLALITRKVGGDRLAGLAGAPASVLRAGRRRLGW